MTAKQGGTSLFSYLNPAKNYLTLIVALIVLVYVVLGATFIFSSQHLDESQRWFFIAVLTVFPVIGLGISIWLILRHFRKLAVGERDDEINWQIMSPEQQQRKLNSEVTELARIMGIADGQMTDLRSAYIVAEDLALRHIERESQIPMMRHITFDNTEFDGIVINQDVIKCVEVTFLVTPDIPQEKINTMLRKVDIAKRRFQKIRPNTRLIFMLALVTQLDPSGEAMLRSTLSSRFGSTPVDVDIRLLDFEGLQKIYALD